MAILPDGSEHKITLAVGQPYRVDDVEWACPVALDGLYPRLADQHGVDSWQTLQLANQLLANLLSAFVRDGGKLMWSDERDPIQLNELFPGIP